MWKSILNSLIASGQYGTQAELVRELSRRGHAVNQGSISRFLRASGIRKQNGVYVGGQMMAGNVPVFSVVLNSAKTLVVLKTAPACAPVLGQFIDDGEVDGVLGTLSGDDTVFAAVEGGDAHKSLIQFLKGAGYPEMNGDVS